MSANPDGTNEDLDLPGNDLDPSTLTPEQQQGVPLPLKIYGIICLVWGAITVPMAAIFIGMLAWALSSRPDLVSIGDPTLTVIVMVLSFIVTVANAVCLIVFGRALMKSRRRNAVRWSHALIALSVTQILFDVMLQGIGLPPGPSRLSSLRHPRRVISITVDPSLRQERELQKRLRVLRGSPGRGGRHARPRPRRAEGYIELNFFNLFWVFMVCSVLGLVHRDHLAHDRSSTPASTRTARGMLFGPFSPIYGVGAVLMTVALNRFCRSQPRS